MPWYVKVGGVVGGITGLVILAVLFLFSGEQTDVERSFDDMVDAARKYDPDRIISYLAMDYNYNNETFATISKQIKRYCTKGQYSGIDVHERSASVVGETATVDAEISVRGADPLMPSRYRIKLGMKKWGASWIITRIDMKAVGR